jgi:quinol monooxygenase YgiN
MSLSRRDFVAAAGAAAAAAACASLVPFTGGKRDMYGLIVKMSAAPGQREALSAILLAGVNGMPGCLSYVVARDPADADALWITEVWDSAASHKASLALPAVQQTIAQARPLIAGFGQRTETEPVGGHGLG